MNRRQKFLAILRVAELLAIWVEFFIMVIQVIISVVTTNSIAAILDR